MNLINCSLCWSTVEWISTFCPMSPDGEMEVDSCVIRRGSHGYAEGLKLNSCNGYESAEYVFNGWTQMLNEI